MDQSESTASPDAKNLMEQQDLILLIYQNHPGFNRPFLPKLCMERLGKSHKEAKDVIKTRRLFR
jgi:hypothetical protein